MNCWVHILRSQRSGRFHCGHTSDLDRRLRQHNDLQYSLSETTKRFEGSWKMMWSQACETRAEAMNLEKAIKKRGIGRYLEEAQSAESA